MLFNSTPYKFKNLKSAYDSMKLGYDSEYQYDIITDEDGDVIVKVTDSENKLLGYLEDL